MPKNIVGVCVLESTEIALAVARELKGSFIFKGSFDKANRTRKDSYRGVGLDRGLGILSEVKQELGCMVTTDVHEVWQVEKVAKVVDVIQIPSLLSKQTDLIEAVGATGRTVNIKKGQFMNPLEMEDAIAKVGHDSVVITERGSCFGNDVIINFDSIDILQGFGYPVYLDVTHPKGDAVRLARAGLAFDVDGIFVEVYNGTARCDGDRAITTEEYNEI